MSDTKQDGGPAFPSSDSLVTTEGMSLRDYFIGQALVGLCANPYGCGVVNITDEDEVAKTCMRYADAMLKAREK